MSVDVIIPWKGECIYRSLNLTWTIAKWNQHGHDPILGELSDDEPFVKANAVQAALKKSRADVIVVTDGDLWVDEAVYAIEDVANGVAPWIMPHININRMNPTATSRVLAGGPLGLPLMQKPYRAVVGGGILVLRRDVYEEAPLDPRFVGWGQEDESWGIALRCLFPDGRTERGELWHLWHPPADRRNRRTGSDESVKLRNRYGLARRSTETMRALLAEV